MVIPSVRQKSTKGRARPPLLVFGFVLLATACPGDHGGTTAQPCVGKTSLFGWGANDSSQLLGLPAAGETTPAQLTNLDDIEEVAAGAHHVLVLKRDGTVWAWGNNDDGQLGDGTQMARSTPVQVFGLRDIRQIAAGANHSMALSEAGVILTWGSNGWGQLGYTTTNLTSTQLTPTAVSGFPALAIAADAYHSIALKSDLTVWTWGANDKGQLGSPGWAQANSLDFPVQVTGLSDVIDIAAGNGHDVALRSDGSVWAWGSNDRLQSFDLGPGPPHFNPPAVVRSPIQVLTGVSAGDHALAAGADHSVVRMTDGTLMAWGANDWGQANPDIGDPVTIGVTSPTLTDVTEVWAGGDETLATTTDGKVWAWGSDESGQLGDAASSSQQLVHVSGLGGLTAVSVGPTYALAVATGVPEGNPSTLTFSGQRVGQSSAPRSITVTNGGSGPLTFCQIAVSSEFSQTNDCPAPPGTIPTSGTCTINVSFAPSSSGSKSGSLTVQGSHGKTAIFPLSGTATAPKATFSPNSWSFGNQAWGTPSAVRQVILSNNGDDTLVIDQIGTSGDFSQTNNCPVSLPPDPNQFCVIDVVFKPLDVGQRTGALTVLDDVGTQYAMSLSGIGTGPSPSFTPASVDFGSKPLNVKSNVKSITLTNTGTADLVIGAVNVSGANASDFTIEVDGCGGQTIAATQQCVVDLTFKPSASGPRQAEVSFSTNAPISPLVVPITGTGA